MSFIFPRKPRTNYREEAPGFELLSACQAGGGRGSGSQDPLIKEGVERQEHNEEELVVLCVFWSRRRIIIYILRIYLQVEKDIKDGGGCSKVERNPEGGRRFPGIRAIWGQSSHTDLQRSTFRDFQTLIKPWQSKKHQGE